MTNKLVGTPGRALLVTGKFLSEPMIQADGQLFGSAWQVAPRDFPVLNCPLVLHCNLTNEKSETYVTLQPQKKRIRGSGIRGGQMAYHQACGLLKVSTITSTYCTY